MTTFQETFNNLIASLSDKNEELSPEALSQLAEALSDIAPVQLKPLLEAWENIPLPRRYSLLVHLQSELDKELLYNYEAFARTLLHDEDDIIRTFSLRLLKDYEGEDLLPTYIDMAMNDIHIDARSEAISLLGIYIYYGELEEISEENLKKIEETILQIALSAEKTKLRQIAIEALGFSSRKEVPALLEKAWQEETALWKASAVFAMGRSYDERWQEEILEGLLHENELVRLAATKAAGDLALALARPILLNNLKEEKDEDVLRASIWSLSEIGGEDVREYLLMLLDQLEDEDEQEAYIEEALANLDFTEDVQNLNLLGFD